MMTTREKLIEEIDTILRLTGMKPTRLGTLALNDPSILQRLREGKDVRLSTADRLREFMKDYRPGKYSRTGTQDRIASAATL